MDLETCGRKCTQYFKFIYVCTRLEEQVFLTAASCCFTYRLLKRDDSFEKKLILPGCGESPDAPLVPEYSNAALFLVLV